MFKYILKLFGSFVLALVVLLGQAGIAQADEISTPSFFKRIGTAILPTNASWSLGNSGNRISSIYVNTFDALSLSVGGTISGDLVVGGNGYIYGSSGLTTPKITATSTALGLQVDGLSLLTGKATTTAGIVPATAGGADIGSLTYPYNGLYTTGTVQLGGALTVSNVNGGDSVQIGWEQSPAKAAGASNQTFAPLNIYASSTGFQNAFVMTAGGNGTDGACFAANNLGATLGRHCQTSSPLGYWIMGSALAFNSGNTTPYGTANVDLQIRNNNVGIGLPSGTAPSEKLEVSGNVSSTKVIASVGSVSAPSITFSGDTDNGMYLFGANSPAIAAGGAVAAYFQSGKIFVKGSYATLADGDGFYFGDNVRGLRYLTGDDFEFAQWHVGGQFYQTVYNGSAYTRYVVHDASTKRSAFSSSVDLRNYTPNTDLEVIGTASATKMIIQAGSASDAALQFSGDPNTGLYASAADVLGITAAGNSLLYNGTSFYPATNNARDLGTLTNGWRNGYFTNVVSSTSLVVSGTGLVRNLGVGSLAAGGGSGISIYHNPSQSEAMQPFLELRNASSTLRTQIQFTNSAGDNSIGTITAYGSSYPVSGDFGFSPANMVFMESTSGTIVTAGDGVAIFSSSGAFRPITGLGFGNNSTIDPFLGTASTTITDGNMQTVALDFPNSVAAGTQDLTVTVAGASAGDECQLAGADFASSLFSRANETYTCVGTAANTMTVRRQCVNVAGCGDPASVNANVGFFHRQ